jgi:tetratricopeptide (TPR) repeat protein
MSFWRREVVQPILDQDIELNIAEQRSILEQDPRNAPAHFALGTLYHFCGDRNAAVSHFEQAIDFDPTYAAPHVSLGRILAVEGNGREAWEHARTAERLGDRSLVEQLERYLARDSESRGSTSGSTDS